MNQTPHAVPQRLPLHVRSSSSETPVLVFRTQTARSGHNALIFTIKEGETSSDPKTIVRSMSGSTNALRSSSSSFRSFKTMYIPMLLTITHNTTLYNFIQVIFVIFFSMIMFTKSISIMFCSQLSNFLNF